jgi:predicted Rossmann fold flavoprotein
MGSPRIVVVGGGAAGFFAAITCAEARPDAQVIILEKSSQFLSKVRISGGGRCNVTHACDDPLEFSRHYPRGGQALISALRRFGPDDTVAWFEQRGVPLKTENDGRVFPRSDSAQSVIDCLTRTAHTHGVALKTNCNAANIRKDTDGTFHLALANGESIACDRLLLAPGGCRAPAAGDIAVSLGHSLESPVPSLFTFHVGLAQLNQLAGIAVETEVSAPEEALTARGPLLITHTGLSGPAVLRLSAWGARRFHQRDYRFAIQVNWLPHLVADAVSAELQDFQRVHPARPVAATPFKPLPARLWNLLIELAGISPATRWAEVSRTARHRLQQQLLRTTLEVSGKSLNKEEFVTCGGVPLREVNFKTMESRLVPGLHFAGEFLDIDGLTGGFNFQAAWTTGWIAGRALAQEPVPPNAALSP